MQRNNTPSATILLNVNVDAACSKLRDRFFALPQGILSQNTLECDRLLLLQMVQKLKTGTDLILYRFQNSSPEYR